jgi:hypothetical protein
MFELKPEYRHYKSAEPETMEQDGQEDDDDEDNEEQ